MAQECAALAVNTLNYNQDQSEAWKRVQGMFHVNTAL